MKNSQYEYQERIKTQTVNAAKLADLQRDHQIAEAIFSSALAKLDTSRLDIYATYPLTQLLTQPGATITRDRLQTKLVIIAGFLVFGMMSLALVLHQMRKTLVRRQHRRDEMVQKSLAIKRQIEKKLSVCESYDKRLAPFNSFVIS